MAESNDCDVIVVGDENEETKTSFKEIFGQATRYRTKKLVEKAISLQKNQTRKKAVSITEEEDLLNDSSDFKDEPKLKRANSKLKLQQTGSSTKSDIPGACTAAKPFTRVVLKEHCVDERQQKREPSSVGSDQEAVVGKVGSDKQAVVDKVGSDKQAVVGFVGSSGEGGETRRCQLCASDVHHLQFQEHQSRCLQKNFARQPGTSVDKCVCQVCFKDITHLTLQRRTMHLNQCIDQSVSKNKDREHHQELLQKAKTAILPCPLCGQKFRSKGGRTNHVKRCAASHEMTVERVRRLQQQQEEEYQASIEAGLLPQEFKPPKKFQRKGTIQKPKSALEEEAQLALALSNSLCEGNDGGLQTVCSIGDTTAALTEAFVKPQQQGRKPKKGKQQLASSLVFSLSHDEVVQRHSDRVAQFILPSSQDADIKRTPPFKASSRNSNHTTDDSSLWSICSLDNCSRPVATDTGPAASGSSVSEFYVASLMPPIRYNTVVVGSKLKRTSAIPGRGRSLQPNIDSEASGDQLDDQCSQKNGCALQSPQSKSGQSPQSKNGRSPQPKSGQSLALSQTVDILADLAIEAELDSVAHWQCSQASPTRLLEQTQSHSVGDNPSLSHSDPQAQRSSYNSNTVSVNSSTPEPQGTSRTLLPQEETSCLRDNTSPCEQRTISNINIVINTTSPTYSNNNIVIDSTSPIPINSIELTNDCKSGQKLTQMVVSSSELTNDCENVQNQTEMCVNSSKVTDDCKNGQEQSEMGDASSSDLGLKCASPPSNGEVPMDQSQASLAVKEEFGEIQDNDATTQHASLDQEAEKDALEVIYTESKDVCAAYRSLVDNERYCDVHIRTLEGRLIPAHKAVLAVRCSRLLLCLQEDEDKSHIDLSEYPECVVLCLLAFVYSGTIEVTPHNAALVKPLAQRLGLSHLAHEASRIVQSSEMTQSRNTLTLPQNEMDQSEQSSALSSQVTYNQLQNSMLPVQSNTLLQNPSQPQLSPKPSSLGTDHQGASIVELELPGSTSDPPSAQKNDLIPPVSDPVPFTSAPDLAPNLVNSESSLKSNINSESINPSRSKKKRFRPTKRGFSQALSKVINHVTHDPPNPLSTSTSSNISDEDLAHIYVKLEKELPSSLFDTVYIPNPLEDGIPGNGDELEITKADIKTPRFKKTSRVKRSLVYSSNIHNTPGQVSNETFTKESTPTPPLDIGAGDSCTHETITNPSDKTTNKDASISPSPNDDLSESVELFSDEENQDGNHSLLSTDAGSPSLPSTVPRIISTHKSSPKSAFLPGQCVTANIQHQDAQTSQNSKEGEYEATKNCAHITRTGVKQCGNEKTPEKSSKDAEKQNLLEIGSQGPDLDEGITKATHLQPSDYSPLHISLPPSIYLQGDKSKQGKETNEIIVPANSPDEMKRSPSRKLHSSPKISHASSKISRSSPKLSHCSRKLSESSQSSPTKLVPSLPKTSACTVGRAANIIVDSEHSTKSLNDISAMKCSRPKSPVWPNQAGTSWWESSPILQRSNKRSFLRQSGGTPPLNESKRPRLDGQPPCTPPKSQQTNVSPKKTPRGLAKKDALKGLNSPEKRVIPDGSPQIPLPSPQRSDQSISGRLDTTPSLNSCRAALQFGNDKSKENSSSPKVGNSNDITRVMKCRSSSPNVSTPPSLHNTSCRSSSTGGMNHVRSCQPHASPSDSQTENSIALHEGLSIANRSERVRSSPIHQSPMSHARTTAPISHMSPGQSTNTPTLSRPSRQSISPESPRLTGGPMSARSSTGPALSVQSTTTSPGNVSGLKPTVISPEMAAESNLDLSENLQMLPLWQRLGRPDPLRPPTVALPTVAPLPVTTGRSAQSDTLGRQTERDKHRSPNSKVRAQGHQSPRRGGTVGVVKASVSTSGQSVTSTDQSVTSTDHTGFSDMEEDLLSSPFSDPEPQTKVTKKNDKTPSPFTPMLPYDKMGTVSLKKHVHKIGVKPVGKKRMRELLKHVYHHTHQYESDSELEATPVKRPCKRAEPSQLLPSHTAAAVKGQSKPKAKAPDTGTSSVAGQTVGDVQMAATQDMNHAEGDLGENYSDDFGEEILQGWPEEEGGGDDIEPPQSTQLAPEAMYDKFKRFLIDNPQIYEKILLYEPLELEVLKQQVKEAGMKCGLQNFINFLNDQCITFTTKNLSTRNHCRQGRGRKPKVKGSSQKTS